MNGSDLTDNKLDRAMAPGWFWQWVADWRLRVITQLLGLVGLVVIVVINHTSLTSTVTQLRMDVTVGDRPLSENVVVLQKETDVLREQIKRNDTRLTEYMNREAGTIRFMADVSARLGSLEKSVARLVNLMDEDRRVPGNKPRGG